MTGKLDPELLRGKDVIFAFTAAASPDKHYLPGHDKLPGAYIHLIAGEALKRGQPIDIGWLPALAITSIILIGALTWQSGRWYSRIALATTLLLVAAKVVLGLSLIATQIGGACFLIAAVSANVSRTRRRRSAQRENPVSGLPNFEALRSQMAFGSATVVAAKEIGRASCRERVCQYV